MLREDPTYFRSIQWQQVRQKSFIPIVKATFSDGGKSDWQINASLKREKELAALVASFNFGDSWFKRQQIADAAKGNQGTDEEEPVRLSPKWFEQTKTKLRNRLTNDPIISFELNTSLPWSTVSKELQKHWEVIQDLRERVGLERDIGPSRVRDEWHEQLRIRDLAKEIERRDGTSGVTWSKLAREAYPDSPVFKQGDRIRYCIRTYDGKRFIYVKKGRKQTKVKAEQAFQYGIPLTGSGQGTLRSSNLVKNVENAFNRADALIKEAFTRET